MQETRSSIDLAKQDIKAETIKIVEERIQLQANNGMIGRKEDNDVLPIKPFKVVGAYKGYH